MYARWSIGTLIDITVPNLSAITKGEPMGHLHFQADGFAHVRPLDITIDFSDMPLKKLVAMRRLGEGMSAKYSDWIEASTSAVAALKQYLDRDLEANVYLPGDFKIVIDFRSEHRDPEVDTEAVFRDVVRFFARENITVKAPTGIRG